VGMRGGGLCRQWLTAVSRDTCWCLLAVAVLMSAFAEHSMPSSIEEGLVCTHCYRQIRLETLQQVEAGQGPSTG
jgi:hypothetical protein